VLYVKRIGTADRGKTVLGSILPAVAQQTNCQKQYPCSELNIQEKDSFRSFTQKAQTLAAQWGTSELTVYFGKPFPLQVRMNVSSMNLRAQPKPLQLESGSSEQLRSAYRSYMVLKKLDFLEKKYGNVILSGDHAIFSICIIF